MTTLLLIVAVWLGFNIAFVALLGLPWGGDGR